MLFRKSYFWYIFLRSRSIEQLLLLFEIETKDFAWKVCTIQRNEHPCKEKSAWKSIQENSIQWCMQGEVTGTCGFLVHNIFVAQKLWIWRNTDTLPQNGKQVFFQFGYYSMYSLNFRVNMGNMILLDGQKKCHDKKSPLKFTFFELQKWYVPKKKCQLTLQKLGCEPPPKKICVYHCYGPWN